MGPVCIAALWASTTSASSFGRSSSHCKARCLTAGESSSSSHGNGSSLRPSLQLDTAIHLRCEELSHRSNYTWRAVSLQQRCRGRNILHPFNHFSTLPPLTAGHRITYSVFLKSGCNRNPSVTGPLGRKRCMSFPRPLGER